MGARVCVRVCTQRGAGGAHAFGSEGRRRSHPRPSSHDAHLDGKDDRGEEKMGCLTISFGLRESGIVSDQCSPRPPGRARGDPTAAELGDGSSLKRVFVSLRG